MKIGGPFRDKGKHGTQLKWYLSFFITKKNADGTIVIGANGKAVRVRMRPFYASKDKAEADKERIQEQYDETGGGKFLFNRQAAGEYEQAKKMVGELSLIEVAKFWRLHHPDKPTEKLGVLYTEFMADLAVRLGEKRTYSDRKSRLTAFLAAGYADRYPNTVTREEIFAYLSGLPGVVPRTKRNHKIAICEFFNWLVEKGKMASNPASGIKKGKFGKEVRKEIKFLKIHEVARYLRAAERYDPELVPHEIIQFVSGVRSDDEMADFRAEFVLPQTREVVIPAAIAKTEVREVINTLEDNFWSWWAAYGPKEGLLRPKNYGPRWWRIRALAAIANQEEADRLARLPIKSLLKNSAAKKAIGEWPWNARRRTFCTYHVAMHQSADRTALIMRHRGSPTTLHDSYRGLGVTQEQGREYFSIQPKPSEVVISPEMPVRGIILKQKLR
jgi:integrase